MVGSGAGGCGHVAGMCAYVADPVAREPQDRAGKSSTVQVKTRMAVSLYSS